MVSLFAVDTRPLLERFDTLVAQLPAERRRRALSCASKESALRCLAGGLLFCATFGDYASDIRQSPYGKPLLTDARPFNLSHSGDYALLGVADALIGVDIEQLKPRRYAAVAGRFLSPAERDYLHSSENELDAFFTLWTLKESYLKAIGKGFSEPMPHADILPAGRHGATVSDHSPFRFRRYDDIDGYAVSVCSLDDRFPDKIEMLTF